MTILEQQGAAAKQAARKLAIAGTAKKNEALEAIARALEVGAPQWLAANAEDMKEAEANGMRPAMLDRLRLTEQRVADIVAAVRQVIALPDPVGRVTKMETRPNGLQIGRKTVPLGVIAIIYEARPNVTVDAAALCLKSGNVCILRGGKESIRSNRCAAALMRGALESVGLPEDCISLVQDTSRESANELMHLNGYVDVLIHEAVAAEFLQKAVPLLDRKHVELRCDEASLKLLGARARAAEDADWDAEYDDYILAVHVVRDLDEAMEFIAAHSTQHSECIVTESYAKAQRFLDEVDAAAVYVNASTRFTDGGEFGMGAEIGISTQKMHARGPMGLEELTSYKYIVYGNGQVR